MFVFDELPVFVGGLSLSRDRFNIAEGKGKSSSNFKPGGIWLRL
jgi:hypothetical protein